MKSFILALISFSLPLSLSNACSLYCTGHCRNPRAGLLLKKLVKLARNPTHPLFRYIYEKNTTTKSEEMFDLLVISANM